MEQDSTEDEPEVDLGNIMNSYIVQTTPNTRILNTGSLKLNVVGPSVNIASSNEQDSTEVKPEVDLGNITNSNIVPTTPNTRIHKDHPIDNVIGEVKSTVQTRRMTKPTSEQGFLSDVKNFCNSNFNRFGYFWICLVERGPLELNSSSETRRMKGTLSHPHFYNIAAEANMGYYFIVQQSQS
ncbi:hypothetical protein Tco_0993638 [Tanacetum coccineum]